MNNISMNINLPDWFLIAVLTWVFLFVVEKIFKSYCMAKRIRVISDYTEMMNNKSESDKNGESDDR